MKRPTIIIVLAGLLVGCSTAPRTAREVLAEASGTEFGAPGALCAETVTIAENSGVDYEKVVNGCLAKRPESMRVFFWLSKHAGFDAASSQGHAAVSGVLFRTLGDSFFGRSLAKEQASVQDVVRDDLLYDLGYGNTDITLGEIKRNYPRTFPKEWKDNKQVKPAPRRSRLLTVVVRKNGRYDVRGKELSDQDLRTVIRDAVAENRGQKVLVRSDRSVEFRHVAKAIAICRELGVLQANIGFDYKPAERQPRNQGTDPDQ